MPKIYCYNIYNQTNSLLTELYDHKKCGLPACIKDSAQLTPVVQFFLLHVYLCFRFNEFFTQPQRLRAAIMLTSSVSLLKVVHRAA